jgi:hypothetical protein
VHAAWPRLVCAVPGPHGRQTVAPAALWYHPSLQPVHALWPPDAEIDPAGHAGHVACAARPCAAPGAQIAHAVTPAEEGWKLPGWHARHAVAPRFVDA